MREGEIISKDSYSMEASRGSGERCWWRWIDAGRYVVVLALTAVIVVVIVYTFKVVLREKQLVVAVKNALVVVSPLVKPRAPLTFALTIEAFNPSGNSRALYTEITVYLAANNRSGIPWIFASFNFGNMTVLPQTYQVAYVQLYYRRDPNDELLQSYYDEFSHGATTHNASLRLEGILRTEDYYMGYKTNKTDGRVVVYCCSSITISYANNTTAVSTDRLCTEQKDTIEEQPDATLLENCVIPQ